MNLMGWINLLMSATASFALGFCVGAILSLRSRCRSLEQKVERLERHVTDYAISLVSIAKRLKDWPLAADMTEGERRMWEDYNRYFREER